MVKGCTFGRICGIMVSVLYVVFYVVILAPMVWGVYILNPFWAVFGAISE